MPYVPLSRTNHTARSTQIRLAAAEEVMQAKAYMCFVSLVALECPGGLTTPLVTVREMRLVVYIDAGCGNILHQVMAWRWHCGPSGQQRYNRHFSDLAGRYSSMPQILGTGDACVEAEGWISIFIGAFS